MERRYFSSVHRCTSVFYPKWAFHCIFLYISTIPCLTDMFHSWSVFNDSVFLNESVRWTNQYRYWNVQSRSFGSAAADRIRKFEPQNWNLDAKTCRFYINLQSIMIRLCFKHQRVTFAVAHMPNQIRESFRSWLNSAPFSVFESVSLFFQDVDSFLLSLFQSMNHSFMAEIRSSLKCLNQWIFLFKT